MTPCFEMKTIEKDKEDRNPNIMKQKHFNLKLPETEVSSTSLNCVMGEALTLQNAEQLTFRANRGDSNSKKKSIKKNNTNSWRALPFAQHLNH